MSGSCAIFLGSKAFGLAILRTLIDAQPDVAWRVIHPADQADSRSALSEFRGFCDVRGLDMTLAANAAAANEAIAGERPDLVVVCGWYFLIPPAVLATSRFLGIHNSLLPKYRGGAPLVWALINGERRVGSSLFGFTPGMDDGPIYLQVAVEPDPDDTIGSVLAALEQCFVAELLGVWPGIISGENPGVEQDHGAATYCGQRMPQDGLVDWHNDAAQVHDFIRAQSRPYPGAFTRAGDKTIRLWRSRPDERTYFGTPGQVLAREPAYVSVACGNGTAIQILDATDVGGGGDLMRIFDSLRMRLAEPAPTGETL